MIDKTLPDVIETTALQAKASAPGHSIWVSANAGSGKTHVLTQRVIRLLMEQAAQGGASDPSKIVCITYTKAAAAEMEARLFKNLSGWALAEDKALLEALAELGTPSASPDTLKEVRRLFAQALETPGGLKIQTIHSFCEGVLRRFPVEADLLPGFVVMDEAEAGAIHLRALNDLAAQAAHGNEKLRAAFALFFEAIGAEGTRQKAIAQLVTLGPEIAAARDAAGGEDAYWAELRTAMGAPSGGTPETWRIEALAQIDRKFLEGLEVAMPKLSKTNVAKAEAAVAVLRIGEQDPVGIFDRLSEAWLNAGGSRPGSQKGNKDVRVHLPNYEEQVETLFDLLLDVLDKERAQKAFELTYALHTIAGKVYDQYTAEKQRTGRLDYDDLITKTVHLMQTTSGAWVLYKLDKGIDHLLLDEAQDTGQLQWSVIEKFRDEFFAAAPDAAPRTQFVVGDKKQSIYSFQGADASLYDQKRHEMAVAINAPYQFAEVPLFLSFRSARAILEVADALFLDEAGKGVHDGAPVAHKSAKPDTYGRVEVWPLVQPPEKTDGNPWDVPVDTPSPDHTTRQLAERICEEIKGWLDGGELLASAGRPIAPGDILILCQKRGAQFHEILRALSRHGIPMAGADRVALKSDVAVRDVLALLRFAANHYDSLSLAEVLKSPLFGVTEAELFTLAHSGGDGKGRTGRSLWSVVLAHRTLDTPLAEKCRLAVADIERAEEVGARVGPFGFISCILEQGTPTGWQRFHTRLGLGCDEALEELLNEALQFEMAHPRTLEGFLAYLEALDRDIKKESAEKKDLVRIMTVHGAKGLESPIVFLADTGSAPTTRGVPLYPVVEKTVSGDMVKVPGQWFCAPGAEKTLPKVAADARTYLLAREFDEYRRKLYVAATRAEERLYLCGVKSNVAATREKERASWHALGLAAMGALPVAQEVPCDWAPAHKKWILETGKPAQAKAQDSAAAADLPALQALDHVPDWLFAPVAEERAPQIHFPSGEGTPAPFSDEGAVLSPCPVEGQTADPAGIDPRDRGILLHALLELLPDVAPENRAAVATQLAATRAAHVSEPVRQLCIDEALAVLDDRQFGQVFSPQARAEVAVHGVLNGQTFSGQIDRLLVTEDEVLVVDYKTHRAPVTDVAATPKGILRQLAVYAGLVQQLYPGRPVRAAVLWTQGPALVPIPEALLKTQ